jgi:hypothetical protein
MDGLRINREHLRRTVREALGTPPTHARFTVSHLQARDVDEELLALPEEMDGKGTLQNATTGALSFMVGISAVDGSDAIV